MKTWLALAAITLTTFMFNSSEFMPVALLSDISASFGLSESQTGVMMTVYAWSVLVLSLPLMILASRLDYRRLMLVVVGLFCTGQVACAFAPSFGLLIAARLIVACSHAVFWSIVSDMATRIAGPRHAPLALSLVMAGSSSALILGLPLGRVVGLAVGWRMTFGCIAILAAVALAALAVLIPKLEKSEPFRVRELPALFSIAELRTTYLATVAITVGFYTAYNYIEPFMMQAAGMEPGAVTAALSVFGVAGVVGSLLHSRLANRTLRGEACGSVLGVGVSMALLAPAAALVLAGGGQGLAASAPLLAVFLVLGSTEALFNAAFQARVIQTTSASQTAVAMSIFSGLFNLGIGSGGVVGGLIIDHVGIQWIAAVGAVPVFLGLALCLRRPRG